MPKPGREQKQFNIKLTGESEIATIEAVQKYCSENKINISDLVIAALRNALDNSLMPPDDSEVLNQRFNELTSKVNAIESTLELLTNELASRKNKTKVKNTNKSEIRAISYLKAYNILPKDIKPSVSDVDKIYDGNDGSRWVFLGIQKSPTSGLPTKSFKRLPILEG
jgi:hypothetical protein